MGRIENRFEKARELLKMADDLGTAFGQIPNAAKHPKDNEEFAMHVRALQNIITSVIVQSQFGKVKFP